MKNVILLIFMSFLCLATTYADRDGRGHYSYDSSRHSYPYDDSRYDSYSSSRNVEYFSYEGSNDYQQLTLADIEEVWVTETRQVRSTCTRRVPVTRRVCRDVRPGHRHGRGHRPPPRRQCRTETSYRTESYTCYKPETVRTRRPDKRFHANVQVEFKNKSTYRYSDARADFVARLDKGNISLELQGQDPRGSNLFFMKQVLQQSNYGDVTEVSGKIKVLVFDKDEFLSPVRSRIDVRPDVHHGELVIKTGKIVFQKGLGLDLNITSDYGRRSLFSGLVPKEFISVREGRYSDESIITVDLDRLLRGSIRRGDRLDIDLTISLMQRNLELLNFRHVPELEQRTRTSVSIR